MSEIIIASVDQIAAAINDTNGVFFSVTFIKRTTGEVRTMTCRTGVSAYVNGNGMKYDMSAKRLIGVWVANEGKAGADAYRSISIDGIQSARISGKTYAVA